MATTVSSDPIGGLTTNYAQQQDDLALAKEQLATRMLDSPPFNLALGSLRSLLPSTDPSLRNLQAMQQLAQGPSGPDDEPDSDDDDDEGDE